MSLRADADGFLIGEPLDLTAVLELWNGVKDDIAAIRKLIKQQAQVEPAPAPNVNVAVTVARHSRDDSERIEAQAPNSAVNPVGRSAVEASIVDLLQTLASNQEATAQPQSATAPTVATQIATPNAREISEQQSQSSPAGKFGNTLLSRILKALDKQKIATENAARESLRALSNIADQINWQQGNNGAANGGLLSTLTTGASFLASGASKAIAAISANAAAGMAGLSRLRGVPTPNAATATTPSATTAPRPVPPRPSRFPSLRGAKLPGAIGAGLSALTAYQEIGDINQSEDLTDNEKTVAKGGAVGGAVGSTAGAVAGAIAGQILIPIPVLGGLIGSVVGGYLGNMGGRSAGEAVTEQVAGTDTGAQISASVDTVTSAGSAAIAYVSDKFSSWFGDDKKPDQPDSNQPKLDQPIKNNATTLSSNAASPQPAAVATIAAPTAGTSAPDSARETGRDLGEAQQLSTPDTAQKIATESAVIAASAISVAAAETVITPPPEIIPPDLTALNVVGDKVAKTTNDFFKTITDAITDAADKANEFIKDNTGIDVAEAVNSGINSVQNAASAANQFVLDKTGVDVGAAAQNGMAAVSQAMGIGSTTGGGEKQLLERLAHGEGTSDVKAQKQGFNSGYDVSYAFGKYSPKGKNLSEMTLGEVKQYQEQMLANQAGNNLQSTAVGKYQFIRKTLNSTQQKLGISDDVVFSPEVQDRMGMELLKGRGYDKWKSGKMSDASFQKAISQEWASVANPETGHSYYGQSVGTTSAEIQQAMAAAKAGSSPDTVTIDDKALAADLSAGGVLRNSATASIAPAGAMSDVPTLQQAGDASALAAQRAHIVNAPVNAAISNGYQSIADYAQRTGLGKKGDGFGLREAPKTTTGHGTSNHKGVDIKPQTRGATPDIRALEDGTVVSVGAAGKAGNQVVVKHADGTTSSYNHLSAFNAKVGDKVNRNTAIGKMGTTGNSSGSHLHLATKDANGEFIDPEKWLKRGTAQPAAPNSAVIAAQSAPIQPSIPIQQSASIQSTMPAAMPAMQQPTHETLVATQAQNTPLPTTAGVVNASPISTAANTLTSILSGANTIASAPANALQQVLAPITQITSSIAPLAQLAGIKIPAIPPELMQIANQPKQVIAQVNSAINAPQRAISGAATGINALMNAPQQIFAGLGGGLKTLTSAPKNALASIGATSPAISNALNTIAPSLVARQSGASAPALPGLSALTSAPSGILSGLSSGLGALTTSSNALNVMAPSLVERQPALSVSSPMPISAPSMSFPQFSAAPSIPEPITSASQTGLGKGKNKDDDKAQDSVGQDVRDRRIAHIVTGGIGAAV